MKTRLIILSIITCAHVGLVSGLVYFDADVVIEDDIEKIDISYGYDGGFIGMHFMFQLRVQFQES